MRVDSKAELVERLIPQLLTTLDIDAWYLLGSGAEDRLRPDSDVDLAVLPSQGAGVDRMALLQFAGDLSLLLGRDVDIGILENTNLVYAKEALLKGDLLWSRDAGVVSQRASTLLSLYLTLQDDRKEVINAYRR